MARSNRFRNLAMAGYVGVIVLLSGGLAAMMLQQSRTAAAQIEQIRAEEANRTLVERLRWSGELIVSTGKAYLISGDPQLLADVRVAQANLDEALETLAQRDFHPESARLFAEVQRAVESFRDTQRSVIVDRALENTSDLVQRFEVELLPERYALAEMLDRFVELETRLIRSMYDQAERERRRLEGWMSAALAVLVLSSLLIAAWISSVLARAYRREEDAVEAVRRALATRNEVVGMVAHDLRNPLGAIGMRAAMLRMSAQDDKARRHAEAIENITQRMSSMIHAMLDVATIEAGQFTVTPAPCDVHALVRDAIDVASAAAHAKRVRIDARLELPRVCVNADRERMLQVFSNLIGNAVKHSPEGARVLVGADLEGDTVLFQVRDEGPGIPREHLTHLFDRFWTHRRAGASGTGLGLFIAKGVLDAHGQTLWVDSDPGHGAAFGFALPICEPPLQDAAPVAIGPPVDRPRDQRGEQDRRDQVRPDHPQDGEGQHQHEEERNP